MEELRSLTPLTFGPREVPVFNIYHNFVKKKMDFSAIDSIKTAVFNSTRLQKLFEYLEIRQFTAKTANAVFQFDP